MAEEEGQKRRHSTRIRRESAAKREAEEPESPRAAKASKAAATSKPAPKSKTSEKSKSTAKSKQQKQSQTNYLQSTEATPAPRVDVLPTRVVDGKPLPTLTQLPTEYGPEYQSIKDSGVIAAALARSRRQWTTEGVFEKYWTKPPPKKRGDPPNPHRQKPGEKVGACKLVVEPHVFDVVLYIVRDTSPQSQTQQYHQYNPPHATTTTGHNNQYTPRPAEPPRVPYQPQNPSPAPQNRPNVQNHGPPNGHQKHQVAPSGRPAQQSPPQQPPSGGDPVIQMLAHRASTNPELKSVMKIVATGTANQEQLEYFQKHIDELHKIVNEQKAREAAKAARPPQPAVRPAAPTPNHPYTNSASNSPYAHNSSAPSYGAPQSFQSQPYHAPTQQRTTPFINVKHVLVEFEKDTSSRFLFPENSILEYGPGFRSCTVSFLVKRKAKDAEDPARYLDLAEAQRKPSDAGKKAEDIEFWQPATVLFQCDATNPSLLTWFSRCVNKASEVGLWMEKVLLGEDDAAFKPSKTDGKGSNLQDLDKGGVKLPADHAARPAGDGVVKPTGDSNVKSPEDAEKDKVKKEDDSNGVTASREPARMRAESRKLAIRLPKEEKTIEIVD